MPLQVIDLTPRIGSEIRTDIETLLSGAEAQAIRHTLGDVPVTAPKSFFGNVGAGGGAVELAVSLLGLQRGTALAAAALLVWRAMLPDPNACLCH